MKERDRINKKNLKVSDQKFKKMVVLSRILRQLTNEGSSYGGPGLSIPVKNETHDIRSSLIMEPNVQRPPS